ncbi:hypothetical protein KAI32_02420 [Candidatus Pacearchaeota archaeon]|nr:hypothetical protein [Candidatus Pacearchaeota archaeon]
MVRSIMIVEMAGRPAEHVKDSLTKHIEVLNEVKDIEVHSIKISEPREIENSSGAEGTISEGVMFTCFAEADFETENFARMSETMFDFMPSSVEVIEPSKVTLDMGEATNLLNNISGRLHRYDDIMKIAGGKLQQMGAELKAAQEALIEGDKEVIEKKVISKKNKVVKKKKQLTPL